MKLAISAYLALSLSCPFVQAYSVSFEQIQTVKDPTAQEVTQIVTADGLKLGASWTLPEQPRAVVLIIQGSGVVGMDGDVSGTTLGSPYHGQSALLSKEIADALATQGIASLRFNKRGVDDAAQIPNETVSNLTQDATAALEMTKARFPSLKHGVVGFSEGATVALQVAAADPVDALFLLSLPSRSMDEILTYQYVQWPVELLREKLDKNGDGIITASELAAVGPNEPMPLLGKPISELDLNHTGQIDLFNEAALYYESYYESERSLLDSPSLQPWYLSFENLPVFSERAQKVKAPVKLYQATQDAQVYWAWVLSDQKYFGGSASLRFYPGLGHCFSPMEGNLGQIKTSGPYATQLLTDLTQDALSLLL